MPAMPACFFIPLKRCPLPLGKAHCAAYWFLFCTLSCMYNRAYTVLHSQSRSHVYRPFLLHTHASSSKYPCLAPNPTPWTLRQSTFACLQSTTALSWQTTPMTRLFCLWQSSRTPLRHTCTSNTAVPVTASCTAMAFPAGSCCKTCGAMQLHRCSASS